jgi:hypothetical protein
MVPSTENVRDLEDVKKQRKNSKGRPQKLYQHFPEATELVNQLPDELVEAPWLAVSNHFENVFVNAGKDCFKYLSLQVLSPYAPKLVVAGNEERIAMNVILLANPGSGKTGIIKKAMKIAPYNKHEMVQKQTQNALQDLVKKNPKGVNIFVNDMKTIMGDSSLLKTYETVIADGFISRDVAGQEQKSDDVRAAMVGGAVPDDISNQIYGGLIFRVIPIQIKYNENQQKQVMDHIAGSVSKQNESGMDTQDISIFYDMLYDCMRGKFDDCPKIVGYKMDEEHTETVKTAVQEAIEELKLGSFERVAFFRQLQDGFRMMALHALLNLHQREIVDQKENDNGEMVGRVQVTEQDAQVAAGLVQQLLGTLNGFLADSNVQEQFSELDKFDSGNEFGTEGVENRHFNL